MNTVLTDSRVRRQDSSRQESRSGSAHYRMKGVSPKPGVRKAPAIAFAAAGQFSDFTYSGGPGHRHAAVSVLFVGDWSSSADQTRATNLQQFVSDMLNSDYMNILSQYGCGSSGSLVSSATVPSPDHELSAADIHGILQSAIDNNLVPDASPSNAYILFLDNATAVDDTTTGAVMCEASSDTAFGYHYHFTTAGGANCYYAVVPSPLTPVSKTRARVIPTARFIVAVSGAAADPSGLPRTLRDVFPIPSRF